MFSVTEALDAVNQLVKHSPLRILRLMLHPSNKVIKNMLRIFQAHFREKVKNTEVWTKKKPIICILYALIPCETLRRETRSICEDDYYRGPVPFVCIASQQDSCKNQYHEF